jgi:DNA-binding response OmpR family regulator
MSSRRVLVVDDEPSIREVLRRYLATDGYVVTEAADGEQALKVLAESPADVVLLDIMMPGLDGLEVLRRLRASSDAFVLLVSARTEEVDRLVGLGMGADDYIVKPFSPREVVARIKAIQRRGRLDETAPTPMDFGSLTIDPVTRVVRVDGVAIALSTLEFDLLHALAHSPGRVFSRRQLLEHVWGYDFFGDERVVDVHIRGLRAKLGDDASAPHIIGTVRGVGYKFVAGQP